MIRKLVLKHVRRFGWPFLLILMLVGGPTGCWESALQASPFRNVENKAVAYLHNAQVNAAEAFAVARSLNAGISFFKSVEIKPWGVGVNPFQALEPVDDVSKDFSQVMIYSMAAVFMQQVFHKISVAVGLSFGLPLAAALLLAAHGLPATLQGMRDRLSAIGMGIMALVIFARLVVPFTGWVGSEVNERFLAGDLQNAMHSMKSVSMQLEREAQSVQPAASGAGEISKPAIGEDPGAFSRIWNKVSNGAKTMVPDISGIKDALLALPERMVVAIQIFVVQTVLLPGTLALLFYLGLRRFMFRDRNVERLKVIMDEMKELKRLAASSNRPNPAA